MIKPLLNQEGCHRLQCIYFTLSTIPSTPSLRAKSPIAYPSVWVQYFSKKNKNSTLT